MKVHHWNGEIIYNNFVPLLNLSCKELASVSTFPKLITPLGFKEGKAEEGERSMLFGKNRRFNVECIFDYSDCIYYVYKAEVVLHLLFLF